MDRKTSFCAITVFHHKTGRATHMVEVFDLSPEMQREMMARAIVGYDSCHPNGPGEPELKFPDRRATAL